jgi:hypothetical protein
MTYKKPILVTGSHRSGSTWAGEMLSLSKDVAYIHEPFNVTDEITINPKQFDLWFYYVCQENSGDTEMVMQNILSYRYPLASNLMKSRSLRHIAKVIRDQYLSTSHKLHSRRPLVKDPIAIFSAEWLAHNFDMDVLVMIRHPAAFCSSLKIKNWNHDFSHFLKQPALMERYLGHFRSEIVNASESQLDVIDQAILLWNCIHHTIFIFSKIHKSWVFEKHEDLSINPISGFRDIFNKFDLCFDESVEKAIAKRTGEHNPIEQIERNEFIRNSKESLNNWRTRLSDKEIEYIKIRTQSVACHFYTDSDW